MSVFKMKIPFELWFFYSDRLTTLVILVDIWNRFVYVEICHVIYRFSNFCSINKHWLAHSLSDKRMRKYGGNPV
jgi:hypothetical protein